MSSRRGSTVALILLGMCLSASGQEKDSAVYPKSADHLFTKDVHERIARFEGPSEETALKAIRALGSIPRSRFGRSRLRSRRMKSTLATNALIRILKSKRSDELRACAANHVAFFCPHDRKQQETVAGLLTSLLKDKTEAVAVRHKIFTALADLHIDSAEIVRGLILGTKSKDPIVVAFACRALGKRKWLRPEIIKALIVVCNDDREWPVEYFPQPIALEAIDALGEHGTRAKRALPTLKPLLDHEDPQTVVRAAAAIARIAESDSASSKRAEVVLRRFLQITEEDVDGDDIFKFVRCTTALEGIAELGTVDDRTLKAVGRLLRLPDEDDFLTDRIVTILEQAGARAKPYLPELRDRLAEIPISYEDDRERRMRIQKVVDAIENAPRK